jgi:hypothetical protein
VNEANQLFPFNVWFRISALHAVHSLKKLNATITYQLAAVAA